MGLSALPTFDVSKGFLYFKSTLAQSSALVDFILPSWMPKLAAPANAYVTHQPTYSDVARAINRCSASASACPFDQLSVIILNRCPIVRTLLHKIIVSCWTSCTIPTRWKWGATVLIYKKGNPDDPSNFRPITLQPVWYTIFSTIYSRKLNDFLKVNGLIESSIQKGFTAGVDGVTEHTELLDHLMKTAKREKRSICVTLLDLKNAFGSVHHKLIEFTLKFHHVPDEFVKIFKDIYSGSYISVAVGSEWTNPIKVE